MPLPFGLSWADILDSDDCCCPDPIPETCADCETEIVTTCFRVRKSTWGSEIPSLWARSWLPPAGQPQSLNVRCGVLRIEDQYGCDARKWSFAGEYTGTEYDMQPVCNDGDDREVTPMLPAGGSPLFLGWHPAGSCNLVELGLWVGSGYYRDYGSATGTGTFERLEQIYYQDLWNEQIEGAIDTRDPDTTAYHGPNWSEYDFTIGGWEFTRADCLYPVAGPTCFRVTGGEVDVVCDVVETPQILSNCVEWTSLAYYCVGGQDSFYGGLAATDGTLVTWSINMDKTEITLVVNDGVDTFSATFAYTPDWFTTGRLVGDYTVGVCADCESYTCFPECLVLDCGDGAQHAALFADVSSLNGCCVDGSYNVDWYDTPGHYYKKIGDPTLTTCGYIEVWYECNSTTFRRRVKITDANGGTSESTEDNAGACVGGEFSDSFDVPSSFLTPLCFNNPPFYTDTVTIDVYT